MAAVPFQNPQIHSICGLTREQCEQAAWAVESSGERYRGAAAIHAALAFSLDQRWILSIYQLPVLRPIEDCVYRWIARIRRHLPGVTPYCKKHPEKCG